MSRGTIERDEATLAVIAGLLWKYGFFESAVQVYDFWHRELRLIAHWVEDKHGAPTSEHEETRNLRGNAAKSRRRRKSLRHPAGRETERENDSALTVLRIMDLTAMEAVIGCVAIRYVLTTEWRDLAVDLLINVPSQEYADQLTSHLNAAFVPSITGGATYNEKNERFTIKSEDIKLWILHQAQLGR